MIPIAGYASRWGVRPGDRIEFKISSQLDQPYSAQLMRITCADPNPDGPGIVEHNLSEVFAGTFASRKQSVKRGSYGVVKARERLPDIDRLSLMVYIWPTLTSGHRQTIMCLRDSQAKNLYELYIEDRRLHGCINNRQVLRTGTALRERIWHALQLAADRKTNEMSIAHSRLQSDGSCLPADANLIRGEPAAPLSEVDQIYFACDGAESGTSHYNGKIEHPQILDLRSNPARAVASWNFSLGIDSQNIQDTGSLQLNGIVVNCPARAMRGHNWNGNEMAWKHAPEQYGAIHFHDDDLYDCKWETDFAFEAPPDLKSAMYSMRIECEKSVEDIPFYVCPPGGRPQARICVIVPTFTYTVYSNQARGAAGSEHDELVAQRGARPWTPDNIPDFGYSAYNEHTDGSGICLASALRPSLTMRPRYIAINRPYAGSGMRHLPADTHLLAWLEHFGYEYDVICDEDLHHEGLELCSGTARWS